MKKFFLFAAAMMMLAASCQRQGLDPVADGDTQVTFTVSTGDVATKAIADGKNVDVLYWEIYGDLTKDALGEGVVRDADGDKTFTVNLRLLADQNYNIIFWAQVDGENHYVVDDLRSVKINSYADEKANDETRAAFFALYPFSTQNGKKVEETVYLYRPFAQINLGATTLETSLNLVDEGKIKVTSTQVTVNRVATSFNTVLGYGEGSQKVTFAHAATPNGNDADCKEKLLEVNGIFYYWLGMNYLIVNGNEKDNVAVDIEVNTNMGNVLHSLPVVPVKENHRTNILGDILTTGAQFTVVVDEDFQEPDYVLNPEDYYTIASVADLMWFQQQVNKEGNNFSGKTVYLTADIDLAGIDWEPIGQTGATTFNGVFDGQNHTISNLNVDSEAETGAYYSSGLFGWVETHSAGCGQIKNVKINGAVVKGHHNCGALVGYITEKYAVVENCHVTGAEISCTYANDDADGDKAGALIGNATVSTVVKDCTAANSTVSAGRDAGQLIGAGREANVTDCSATSVAVQANGTGSGANVRNEVIGRLL